jgi:hypothetical protein
MLILAHLAALTVSEPPSFYYLCKRPKAFRTSKTASPLPFSSPLNLLHAQLSLLHANHLPKTPCRKSSPEFIFANWNFVKNRQMEPYYQPFAKASRLVQIWTERSMRLRSAGNNSWSCTITKSSSWWRITSSKRESKTMSTFLGKQSTELGSKN